MPADKEYREDYSLAVATAIVHVQSWYRQQLGGSTFDIYSVVPEPCHLPEPEEYYAYTEVWERVLEGVQPCAPVGPADEDPTIVPHYIWALYVDVHEACDGGQSLGAGAFGLTLLPGYDLALMIEPGTWTFCDVGTIERTYGSVLGGLAHELAHTFRLPHPPDCDPVELPSCDDESLMWNGWYIYPDTYLREEEKAVLLEHPYFKQ